MEEPINRRVVPEDLESAYAQMAKDKAREKEALEWAEGMLKDIADETT